MKKILMAMLLALGAALAPALCAAQSCITDVMVVGGENKSVTNSYAALGWKVIKQDLNAGAGGDYIYLLYKVADSASVSDGFITGFYIKTGAVTNELTHVGRRYRLVPCDGSESFVAGKGDLNSKTKKLGDNIHLYCTKAAFDDNRAVTDITFNSTQSGAVGANGGTTGYDLNSHAEGDFIYMHVSTAEVPYVSPVSVTDVIARQRWPWNGLVDITCTVSGIEWAPDMLDFAVAAVMQDSGAVHNATHFWTVLGGRKSAVRNVSTNGYYRLLWDAGADLGMGEIHSNVVVRVTAKGHANVQLWEGGPYWATTNVGAEKPEDYGCYFWWGDTIGYKWENGQWVANDGSVSGFAFWDAPTNGKDFAPLQSEGWITSDGVLAPEHDAAHVHWGGGWRMPTQQELEDLFDKCNWSETEQNNVKGWTVTGKGVYASASIFLPYAGCGYGSSFRNSGSYGYCWSSVPNSEYNIFSWYLTFSSSYLGMANFDRYYGHSVRPVQGSMLVAGGANAGDSAKMVLDLRTERESGGDETLLFSSLWDGDADATVTIAQDGVVIAENLAGEGEQAWSVPYNGTYVLTHVTYTNGVAGKAETATFVVTGKVDPPVVVSFDEAAYSVDEGGTLEVVVKGGNATMPSRAAVYISYLTAAAADLDLKNGAIDGVTPKGGLKFPLLLTWDAGDAAPKKISIPVKADKAVEGYETFVLQLAEFVGMGPGETDICMATVKDPSFDALSEKIAAGTATKAESNTWNKVNRDGVPYMCGLADPADGGKVAGSGYCPENKKVTLKATASKNFAFVGWASGVRGAPALPDGEYVATTPTLVIDRSAKPAKGTKTSTTISNLTESATFYAVFEGDPLVSAIPVVADDGVVRVNYDAGKVTGAGRYAPGKKVTLKATASKGYVFAGWAARSASGPYQGGGFVETALPDEVVSQAASLSFVMPSNDVAYVATFVTVDADKGSIELAVDGTEMRLAGDGSPHQTNVWAGVYLQWPIAASALSQTTVKVAGLPAGLKFTDKPVTSKVGSGKAAVTVTNVPANTIYGAPTAASKADKDGMSIPSTVKVTVTTAGKTVVDYVIALTVDPIAPAAVGTYNGLVGRYRDGAYGETFCAVGMVTLTAGANGKVTAKATLPSGAVSFSAPRWDSFEDDVYAVEMSAKSGEVLAVALDSGRDWWVARVDEPSALTIPGKEPYRVVAWRNEHGGGGQIVADKNARDLIAKLPLSPKYKRYYALDGAGDDGYDVTGYGNLKISAKNLLELLAGANGTIKYAGKLEGKSFSGSALLNIFDEGYRHWEWSSVNECVMGDFVVFPSKTEAVHFVIRFGPNTEGLLPSVNYTAE